MEFWGKSFKRGTSSTSELRSYRWHLDTICGRCKELRVVMVATYVQVGMYASREYEVIFDEFHGSLPEPTGGEYFDVRLEA